MEQHDAIRTKRTDTEQPNVIHTQKADTERPHVIHSKISDWDLGHILDNLTRRVKVKHAAILDRHGNVVKVTSDWKFLPDDGHILQKVLMTAPTRGLWRLKIFGDDFQCFHCDDRSTILGHSQTTVMTAHVTRKYIVVGLAPEQDSGSCLYEVKQAWLELESRKC